ncbi:MAG: CHAD domain-containing protein, partial [Ferrovum sp.]|nr:CHAD domain-containing protein [Ferrovum sp.]
MNLARGAQQQQSRQAVQKKWRYAVESTNHALNYNGFLSHRQGRAMDLSFLNPKLPLSALEGSLPADKALRIVLGHCLKPIIVNASKIASGTYGDAQVHQLRVGLRRLRSALHLFEGWAALPEPTAMTPLKRLFRDLGAVRDQTVLRIALQRLLHEDGAPPLHFPAAKVLPDLFLRVRTPEVQQALLQLISFVS